MTIVEKGTPPKDEEVSDTYESQIGESYPGKHDFLTVKYSSSLSCLNSKMVSFDFL